MTLASGLGAQFGLAKETTYGTVVTPNRWFEFDSESFKRDPTYMESVGLKAGRTFQPASRVTPTTRQAGGDPPMDVPTKAFGAILDLMHGLVVTPVQQGVTTAYKQTHLIGTSQPNKSATLQFNKPDSGGNDHAYTYPGSVLTQLALSCDVGGLLKTTPTFDSQDELDPTTTPAGPALATASYPTGIAAWNHTQGSVTVNGSAVGVVKSFALTWAQPYKADRWFMGSGGTKLKPIPNGFASVTGNLVFEFLDNTIVSLFRSGTPVSVVLDFVGAQIASPYNYEFKITLDQVQFRGDSPNVAGPDVLELNAPVVCLDGGTNPPMQIDLTETATTV